MRESRPSYVVSFVPRSAQEIQPVVSVAAYQHLHVMMRLRTRKTYHLKVEAACAPRIIHALPRIGY